MPGPEAAAAEAGAAEVRFRLHVLEQRAAAAAQHAAVNITLLEARLAADSRLTMPFAPATI